MTDSDDLRAYICEIGRRAYAREMGAANDGNISVLLDDGTLLCTPTAVSKGFMTPDMICRIDRDGALVEDRGYRPSTEMKMHLCVYDHRPDVRSVVHAHPLYATVHAICGKPMTAQIMPESTMFLGEVPLTPYGTPSTPELSDAIIPYLERHDALLLENHGARPTGTTSPAPISRWRRSTTMRRCSSSRPSTAARVSSMPSRSRSCFTSAARALLPPAAIR